MRLKVVEARPMGNWWHLDLECGHLARRRRVRVWVRVSGGCRWPGPHRPPPAYVTLCTECVLLAERLLWRVGGDTR